MMPAQATTALLFLAVSLAVPPAADQRPAASGDLRLRPKTIAVVSGINKEVNLLAVKLITQALAKDDHLEVLSTERVAAKLRDYPYNIRGPYRAEYFNITDDYDNTDVATIKRIKRTLGVDYLYVVWMPGGSSDQFGHTSLYFMTQLFEGPECTLVHNGSFSSTAWGGINCCLAFKRPTGEQQTRRLEESCERHAREVAEEIKVPKKSEL